VTDFVEYLETKLLPEWAKGELGARLLSGGVGVMFDALADQQTRAVCSGLIASPSSPDDVLPLVGRERGDLWRMPGESAASYRSRLINATSAWDYAGADKAIVDQLALAGFPGATIVSPLDRVGPHGEPAPYYSQFWVAFPLDTLLAHQVFLNPPTWGEDIWGFFWWGSGALSPDDARLFLAIVNKFKPADHVCRGIEQQT
jgi:hypothetical protein